MVEIEEKVGNPWSILPIKNSKYARDLVEVHLSDRMLTRLEQFDAFPNLEVIWLNNNNVRFSIPIIFFLIPFCNNHHFVFSYGTWTTSKRTSE